MGNNLYLYIRVNVVVILYVALRSTLISKAFDKINCIQVARYFCYATKVVRLFLFQDKEIGVYINNIV